MLAKNSLVRLNPHLGCGLAFALLCAATHAAPVLDWHTFKATTATTLSGQGTDDPVIGSLATTADASFVLGYLSSPVSLVNVGDQITLTFSVAFNDATGMANAGDNFRFALFDLNGQTPVAAENSATAGVDGQTDNFRGYMFGVRNGTGTGSGGSMRERTAALVSGDNSFATGSPNNTTFVSPGSVGGDPVTLLSSVNGDGSGPIYTGVMTFTLTASGIDLSGSFSGTNSANMNVFTASDNAAPTSTTYGAVGFLIGDALNVEEVSFSNVDVTYAAVPEPGALALWSLGSVLLLRRQRRR